MSIPIQPRYIWPPDVIFFRAVYFRSVLAAESLRLGQFPLIGRSTGDLLKRRPWKAWKKFRSVHITAATRPISRHGGFRLEAADDI